MGNEKNIRRFTSAELSTFIHNNYTTDKIIISIIGNTSFDKVIKLCMKYFGSRPSSTSKVQRCAPTCYNHFVKEKNKHIHQTHALVGCNAYNTYSNKKVAFTLVNNILGGPALNSRLNIGIREKYGLCYNIESQYVPFSDSGLFYIYVAMDKEFKDRIIELIFHEINRLKNTRLSNMQLSAAKHQLIGQLAINEESALNEMLAMGKAYMNFGKVDSLEEINNDIMAITAEEIQDIANEILVEENFSKLIYY